MEALGRILNKVRANTQDLKFQNQNSQENLSATTLYNCELCKDTGYIIIPNENSQPTFRQCECLKKEIVKRQWNNSGINIETATQTFNTFEAWNDSSKVAKETAIGYFQNFKNIRKNKQNSIMLCGQVGSGKTHLSIALAINFMQKGYKVVYMPYRDVITKVKQNMTDEECYKKTISKYQVAEILLIDDLYKGKINESDINIMFEIINYRYLNRLPIIVSSEFIMERMLNFDEGIGSRVYQMCKDYIIEIEGKENNYRLK